MTKIALGAGLGGLMIAVEIASALHAPAAPGPSPAPRASTPRVSDATPDRCRTITMPDGGCDAAWDARRRHFFGGVRVR